MCLSLIIKGQVRNGKRMIEVHRFGCSVHYRSSCPTNHDWAGYYSHYTLLANWHTDTEAVSERERGGGGGREKEEPGSLYLVLLSCKI